MATKKKSNYDGYVGVSENGGVVIGKSSRLDRARGAAEGFKRDYESMRTTYETYKRKGEPDSKTTQKQIEKGSESAIKRVQKAGEESDYERKREERRGRNESAASGKSKLDTRHNKY